MNRFGRSFAFGKIFRIIIAVRNGKPITRIRVSVTFQTKSIVIFPTTIGSRKIRAIAINKLVMVKPVNAKPVLPFRKETTTGAAVAVGVIPTKKAVIA